MPSLKWYCSPAYLDEARRLVQQPICSRLLEDTAFGPRCLNAGCGDGLYVGFLASRRGTERTVHIDLNVSPILAMPDPERNDAIRGSLTELPFKAGSFDACLCTEVLEHIPDDHKAVAELARILKPAGWVLVSTPTPPAPYDPAHVREGYTLSEMKTLLEVHGFKVVRHAYGFHLSMRILNHLWNWQFRVLGRWKRSWCPRFVLHLMVLLDRMVPVGEPWDLVVLAQKE